MLWVNGVSIQKIQYIFVKATVFDKILQYDFIDKWKIIFFFLSIRFKQVLMSLKFKSHKLW